MAQVEIIKPNLITEEINTENNSKKRVCAYARVSTDNEEQLTSYNSQIEFYSNKIKSNPNWEFVGIYADEGISGTQIKNRTEFQRMINDALSGKIDIIMTKSISRFARNVVDTLKNVRELREHNVDVYFEKENIHTLDLDSEMFLALYSTFAQAESESTSLNVKLGLKAKMKRGEYVGCPKCYGYKLNKETKELEIVEEQASVVKMIFNWYADGLGARLIARKLNELNIKSPKDGKFKPETVFSFINNEKYVGDLLQQKSYTISPITHKRTMNYGEKEKYYVKDHHTPIISRELWDKCQEILSKRSKKLIPNGKSHNDKYSRQYAFSSKIKCGICGKNFVRKSGGKLKDGTSVAYWLCYHRVTDKEKCSESITIKENILEEIFLQVYNTIIQRKHKTKDKLLNAIKELITEDNTKTKLDKLYKEKEVLQKRLSTLIDMKLDNIENKEIYVDKEKELNSSIRKINDEIKENELLKDNNKSISRQLEKINKVILESDKSLKEFDKPVFDNMVDKIVIGERDANGECNPYVIRIFLNIGTEYKGELIKKNNSIDGVSFVESNKCLL